MSTPPDLLTPHGSTITGVFADAAGSPAEAESEVCSFCDGLGSITYNPNLNPNAFPATASTKCTHCGGTGSVEETKPQGNAKLMDAEPVSGASARNEATPKSHENTQDE
jgi:hypothetical protein